MNNGNNRFKGLSKALKGEGVEEQFSEDETEQANRAEESPKQVIQSEIPQKKKSRASGKRSNPDYEQIGIYIPKNLHRKAKKLLLDHADQDFSDLMTELLEKWVKSKDENND